MRLMREEQSCQKARIHVESTPGLLKAPRTDFTFIRAVRGIKANLDLNTFPEWMLLLCLGEAFVADEEDLMRGLSRESSESAQASLAMSSIVQCTSSSMLLFKVILLRMERSQPLVGSHCSDAIDQRRSAVDEIVRSEAFSFDAFMTADMN